MTPPCTEAEQLREIIEWLLGERGEFPEQPEGQRHALYWWQRHALYWWRKELRRRVETVRVVPPVAPRRVPPSHKGVTYRDGMWQSRCIGYSSVASVIHCDATGTLTDDDYRALLALRDAPPSDPVREALEAIFLDYEEMTTPNRETVAIDAIVALIDQHAAPELTAEQCVARLVELGWTDRPGIQVGAVMRRALIAPAPERAP